MYYHRRRRQIDPVGFASYTERRPYCLIFYHTVCVCGGGGGSELFNAFFKVQKK
jgi:hypothetical protein